MKSPFPNTFLIGVQKAGTTSLDNWIGQHPQVYSYTSLKDIPLFVNFHNKDRLNQRLLMEKRSYKNEKIILHTAVNYIFYPSLLQEIAKQQPHSKLLLVLRNPVERAISAYLYFYKMLREKRNMQEALIYQPKKNFEITRHNNDFTYIEHGFYFAQIKTCLQYFSREQLMILDYDELKTNAENLLKNVFYFLEIDETFKPNFKISNITGDLRSMFLQKKMLQKNTIRKWIVNNFINPWLPVNKRKVLKNRFFELNTDKQKQPSILSSINKETIQHTRMQLREFYLHDAALLDEMLNTSFYKKWFMHDVISNN